LFEDLVRLLAVHETAEEEAVHPTARRKLDHGEEAVENRLYEEDEAKRALAELYDLGVEHPEFDAGYPITSASSLSSTQLCRMPCSTADLTTGPDGQGTSPLRAW
jgi:hypothetical protein